MKNHSFAFLGLGLLPATGTAYAPTIHFRANVPFSLVVARGALLGDEYTTRCMADLDHELSLNGIGQSARAFLQAQSLSLKRGRALESTKLVFDRHGDPYFLAEIWEKGKVLLRPARETRQGCSVGWHDSCCDRQ